MTDPLLFLLALLSLLLTPGPTNTLLATSGAAGGFQVALRLVPAEAAGYAIAVTMLSRALAALRDTGLPLETGLRVAVALYLVLLAWNLWRHSRVLAAERLPIGPRQVFLTTLLNPKGLVIAALLPPGPLLSNLPHLASLIAVVAACGCAWVGLGAYLRRLSGRRAATLLGRAGSVVLVGFAALLLASVGATAGP